MAGCASRQISNLKISDLRPQPEAAIRCSILPSLTTVTPGRNCLSDGMTSMQSS